MYRNGGAMSQADANERTAEADDLITATMEDGGHFLVQWRDSFVERHSGAPERVYHYTNSSSLIRILEDNEVWATNAVFLNDQNEIRHAAVILSRACDTVIGDEEFASEDPSQLLLATTAMRRVLNHLHDYIEAYVTCFCSEGDLLSQWRGYGEGDGLSIGFDSAELSRVAKATPGIVAGLVQVTYDEEQQYAELYELAKRWTRMFLSCLRRDSRTKPHVEAMLFAQCFAWLAATFKHPAFAEEKEWRLVYVRLRLPELLPEESFKLSLRSSKGMVVPFIRIMPCDEEKDPVRLPVKSVRVGPHRYPALAASGVWHLVTNLGLADEIKVDYSFTPLRT
jgi:hypothetical protein